MAELRHSTSMGARANSSPLMREEDSSPLIPEHQSLDNDDHDRHFSKDRDRQSSWFSFHSLFSYFSDDARVSPNSSRILQFVIFLVVLAGLISIFSIVNRLSGPYLCRKDGIVLHCPPVKEPPSLWENPYSATTSWKLCAERLDVEISDM